MRAPEKTIRNARRLRKAMTLPEVMLWRALRRDALHGLRFRRQHPIGPYVFDFYCAAAKLAIEVDGMAHDAAVVVRRDKQRSQWLETQGVRVMRFNATDILDKKSLEGVLLAIVEAAAPSTASRSPSPADAGKDQGLQKLFPRWRS